MNALTEATKWMSLFCRFRDAIEWSEKFPEDITGIEPKRLVVKCCTCPKIGSWLYTMEGGHFIPKGSGGQSGVRWDERNVHAQCPNCNAFNQGRTLDYEDYMKEKYGQEVIDELRRKDKLTRKRGQVELMAIALHYKQLYHELLESL